MSNFKLPAIFKDGMVLQRGNQTRIWGSDLPDQVITIEFLNDRYETVTKEDGTWQLVFHDLPVSGSTKLKITGSKTVIINNILVGDVYLLAGQSNMQLPMARVVDLFEDEINHFPSENNWLTSIRQFTLPQRLSFHEPMQEMGESDWVNLSKESIKTFSAIGYFFAKSLYEKYGVPIGLILTAVGGTPIEAWMSEGSVKKFIDEKVLIQLKDDRLRESIEKEDEASIKEWYQTLDSMDLGLKQKGKEWYRFECDEEGFCDFLIPDHNANQKLIGFCGAAWFRYEFNLTKEEVTLAKEQEKILLYLGSMVDSDTTYLNENLVGSTGYQYPPRRYYISPHLLKEGKNLIAIRLICNSGFGKFIVGKPYELRFGETSICLSGNFKMKIGAVTGKQKEITNFSYKPCGLFHGVISPLKPYTISAILWYQGESNTGAPENYHKKFELLVKDWRKAFLDDKLPFLFVQLANYIDESVRKEDQWAIFREEQRKCLAISNTAMVVAADVGEGNDLHPQNKKAVADRLSLCARKMIYREELVCSGPMLESIMSVEDKVRLFFSPRRKEGLFFLSNDSRNQLYLPDKTQNQDNNFTGFEIADHSGTFVRAEADINGEFIEVYSSEVKNPAYIRYGWANNPVLTLYNAEGLPAVPFMAEVK